MKRPLFDVGIAVLLGSAVVLYGNIYCYLLLPVLLAAAMICAGRAANPRWRKAAVCALSAAASILLMLSVSLSLERYHGYHPHAGQLALQRKGGCSRQRVKAKCHAAIKIAHTPCIRLGYLCPQFLLQLRPLALRNKAVSAETYGLRLVVFCLFHNNF